MPFIYISIYEFNPFPANVIDTRMSSLRNQRMFRLPASGSAPPRRSERQLYLLQVLRFLRTHIKVTPSLSSYSTQPVVDLEAEEDPVDLVSNFQPQKKIKKEKKMVNILFIFNLSCYFINMINFKKYI